MKKRKKAFTLVEVALSLVILAVGLTSVFALFPAGLEQTSRATQDTRVSMFAMDIAAGLKARVATMPWNQINESPSFELPVQAPSQWSNTDSLHIVVDGERHDRNYEIPTNDESHTISFKVSLEDVNDAHKKVIIEIWPSRYMPDNSPFKRNYYTELYDPGVN